MPTAEGRCQQRAVGDGLRLRETVCFCQVYVERLGNGNGGVLIARVKVARYLAQMFSEGGGEIVGPLHFLLVGFAPQHILYLVIEVESCGAETQGFILP